MKKIYTLLFLLAGFVMSVSAGTNWTLQGKAYNVDTVFHAKIGPGTTQTNLKLTGGSYLEIFYVTVDLTDPNVDIRVATAGSKLAGGATLSTMCKNASKEGAEYFAGVNADFFGNSQPIGSTVVNSEIFYGVGNNWVNWFMTDEKRPGFGTIGFSGTAANPSGATHKVAGVNTPRYENNLVIYNQRIGANTGTNVYGHEVSMEPVDGHLAFAGESKFKVTSAPSSAGKMAIPANGYVLSGNGTAAAFVQTLNVGDIVTFNLNTKIAGFEGKRIKEMASGQPMILSKGVTLETQGALDHLVALNPRTAVGYDETGTKLVLLVVDGRRVSAGVVSKVLADIMRETGCSEAMNFDGGGSSELYATHTGVVNNPSDGKERAVVNSVWAVATSPADSEIAEIRFEQNEVELPKYAYYSPTIYAYNKYGVLLSKNQTEGIVLSCDEKLGEIIKDGSQLFVTGSGYHALTASYGNVKASCAVMVGDGEPAFRLSTLLIDDHRSYKTEVSAPTSKGLVNIDNSALIWKSANPEIATVDENGVIKGIKNGKTTVTGILNNIEQNLAVTVEIPENRGIEIYPDGFVTGDWKTGGSSVKNQTLTPINLAGFALDFTLSGTRAPRADVKGKKEFYSLPDSIRLVINPGTTSITKIIVGLTNNAGQAKDVTITPTLTPEQDNVVLIPISDFYDVDDMINYPVSLTSMLFYISGKTNQACRIEVPSIKGVYVNVPGSSGVDFVGSDPDANADPIYYDLNGRRVNNPEKGLYIIKRGSKATKEIL